MTLGVGLVIVGLLGLVGRAVWFGRLPGDIRIERDTVRIYIPLVSLLVMSVALNLLFYLLRRLF